MEIEIDLDIIKKTNFCQKDFDCLKNPNHVFKQVDRLVDWKVLFVHCTERGCTYYMDFGGATVCNCPTRQAIYKKYAK